MTGETRHVSSEELDQLRRSARPHSPPSAQISSEEQVRPSHGAPERNLQPAGFDPESILQDWSPGMERFLWKAPLRLDTRVEPRTSRIAAPPSTRRARALAVAVLFFAVLIAIGLYLAVQLFEPTDETGESLALVTMTASWNA